MCKLTSNADSKEARLEKLNDAATRAEAARTAAMFRQDAIGDEILDNPQQEADIQRRVDEVEEELVQLQEAVDDAVQEFNDALQETYGGDQEGGGESLSVGAAADIWLSNGMDEDYTFGYAWEELKRAAGLD